MKVLKNIFLVLGAFILIFYGSFIITSVIAGETSDMDLYFMVEIALLGSLIVGCTIAIIKKIESK